MSVLMRGQHIEPIVVACEIIILRGHGIKLGSSWGDRNKSIGTPLIDLKNYRNFSRDRADGFPSGPLIASSVLAIRLACVSNPRDKVNEN